MALTVTVLGCDGSYAGPGGACTGFLVRSATTAVWVDAGPGTLANLQRHVSLRDLDGIVVTHEHPDHCMELPVLRNALKYIVGREGLPVVTTAATRAVVDHISGGAAPTFAWQVVADGGEARIGDLAFRFARTDHPVETLAVRVDGEGRSLAFTADTGPAFSLDGLAAGTGFDLAVCEASLAPDEEGTVQHLTARQAGEMARSAGARRVLLTHLVPGSDAATRLRDAREAFGGPVEVASPHDTHEV